MFMALFGLCEMPDLKWDELMGSRPNWYRDHRQQRWGDVACWALSGPGWTRGPCPFTGAKQTLRSWRATSAN